jgi:hypothetical protein
MALGIFDIIMIPHERKYEEICYSPREYIQEAGPLRGIEKGVVRARQMDRGISQDNDNRL